MTWNLDHPHVVVTSWSKTLEVMGSNPTVLGFFLLYPFSSASLIQVPCGGATLLIFL